MFFTRIKKTSKNLYYVIYTFSVLYTVFFLLLPVMIYIKLFVLATSFIISLLFYLKIKSNIIIDICEGMIFIGDACYPLSNVGIHERFKFGYGNGYMIRLRGSFFKISGKDYFLTDTIKSEIDNYFKMYFSGGVVFDSYKEEVPGKD